MENPLVRGTERAAPYILVLAGGYLLTQIVWLVLR